MRRWGMVETALLAVLALLALPGASAAAATTITVNEDEGPSGARLSAIGAQSKICEDENGGCTLRAAVQLADQTSRETGAEAVTINVPAGTYLNTAANGGTLLIEDGAGVVIVGAGPERTMIEGGEGSTGEPVFTVQDGGTLTVRGVTVLHGDSEPGKTSGAGDGNGGGIDGDSGSSITVEESTITHNSAARNGGGVFGGHSPAATITIKRSSVTHNSAKGSFELLQSEEGEEDGGGGGVYGEPGANVTIEQSTVADNEADHNGGGVYAGNAERVINTGCPSLRPSRIAGSDAQAASGGGGLTIKQSTIEGNLAEAGDGGGIFVSRGEERECVNDESLGHAATAMAKPATVASSEEAGLTIEQSTIARNRAEAEGDDPEEVRSEGDGGGIYEEERLIDPIVDSTITENVAEDDGGGVYTTDADVAVLVSDTVFGNIAEAEETQIGTRAARHDTSEGGEEVGNNLAGGETGTIELRDTIVAEPTTESQNCEGNVQSLVFGAGYNLDYPSTPGKGGSDTCGLSEEDHDLVGAKPELDPSGLQKNGGPTETIALLASSPAIGFVPIAEDCEEEGVGPALPNGEGKSTPVDQRGEKRPGIPGKGCDVGAYEYQEPTKTPAAKREAPNEEQKPTAKTSVLPFKAELQCTSLRDITIHIQHIRLLGVTSAVVSIDGKNKRTLTGKRLITAINLRGLPKGTFTIEILARTRSGHTLHGQRVYHTCHNKLRGHAYLRL